LRELELPRRHGLTIVAMQRENETMIALDPDQRLRPGDILVTVSHRGMAAKLMEKFE
jgi:Trk K+ transport system NAD-binding subunit